MKPLRKYLHAEVLDGQLYVYYADRSFDAKEITLKDMDNECLMPTSHVVLKPEELMKSNIKKRKTA